MTLKTASGYVDCGCRDCMETAVGEPGDFCDDCQAAGCEPDSECQAENAYDHGGKPEAADKDENFSNWRNQYNASKKTAAEGDDPVNLQALGEKMQHWHSSGGDPIYAVGSYFASGKRHPQAGMEEKALAEFKKLRSIQEQRGSWSGEDEQELYDICDELEEVINSGPGEHAATVAQTRAANVSRLERNAAAARLIRIAKELMAMQKTATINDERTLEQLIDMAVESATDDSDRRHLQKPAKSRIQVTPEVKSAARAFDDAVESSLLQWCSSHMDELNIGKGPLTHAAGPEDVVSVMQNLRGGAGYLYFMEHEGAGVGTHDGDWDVLFKSSDTEPLSEHVLSATKKQYQALEMAIQDAAFDAIGTIRTSAIVRLKVHTGPVNVKQMGEMFQDAGLQVHTVGTEHLYVTLAAADDDDDAIEQVLSALKGKWGPRALGFSTKDFSSQVRNLAPSAKDAAALQRVPCRLGEDPNYCLTHRQWACPFAKRRPEVAEDAKAEKAKWEEVRTKRLETESKNAAAPKLDLQAIRRWMGQHVDEHIDDVNEVDSTGLAEAAAEQFDAYEDTRDYKIPEEVFDLAAEISIQHDSRRASVPSMFPRQADGDGLRTLAVSLYRGILGKAGHEVAKAIQEALKQAFELGQQGKTAAVISAAYTQDQVRRWMSDHANSIGGADGGFDPQELAKQAAEYFGINDDIPEWVFDMANGIQDRHAVAAQLVALARQHLASPQVRWRMDQDAWSTCSLDDLLRDNEWDHESKEVLELLEHRKVQLGGGAQPTVDIELV